MLVKGGPGVLERWSPQYGGPAIAFGAVVVHLNRPHSLHSCVWRWPASPMGQYIFVPTSKYSIMCKTSFDEHNQILPKYPCRFKTWMEFVRWILIDLETSCTQGFLKLLLRLPQLMPACNGHSMTNQAWTASEGSIVVLQPCESRVVSQLCILLIRFLFSPLHTESFASLGLY